MPEIIAVTSPKGGCGATSVCAGIWHFMADMGIKVLSADLCSGRCTLDFALGMQNDSVYDISDVISGICSLDDAVCRCGENAFFLRGSEEPLDINGMRSIFSGFDCDYIILDVPPSERYLDMLHDENIDKLIAVTDCSQISAKICGKYIGCHDTDKINVIVNKIIPSYIEQGIFPYVDEILDDIGVYPLGLLPWSFGMIAATSSGINAASKDAALAESFKNTVHRICGERVAAMDFDKLKIEIKNKKSFVNRNNGR